MSRRNDVSIGRTIRRQQLREIVPLADSTIYEMCQTQSYLRIGQRYLRMTQNPL
jgi:prophage regulatory protein